MKRILLLVALAGCVQFQFDQPLKLTVEAHTPETQLVSQTFSCNFDLSLDADVANGTLHLLVEDGITNFYEETFHGETEPLTVAYQNQFRSTAPIQVTLNRENFVGNITFNVECS